MNLYEQYRPTQWSEVIAQKPVLRAIDRIRARGFGGHAFWISGASGTGKTTIARLIAGEVASDWCTEEIDATFLSAGRIQDLERQSQTLGMGDRRGRAYIVNEAHGLGKEAVRQLLTTLERVPPHVVWIFTTTNEGQQLLIEGCIDGSPLRSRCIDLALDTRGLVPYMAKRLARIARLEGYGNHRSAGYVELVRAHNCNLRAAICAVEAGWTPPGGKSVYSREPER